MKKENMDRYKNSSKEDTMFRGSLTSVSPLVSCGSRRSPSPVRPNGHWNDWALGMKIRITEESRAKQAIKRERQMNRFRKGQKKTQ